MIPLLRDAAAASGRFNAGAAPYPAPMIYLDNLGRALSVAAANMTLTQKVRIMEQAIGREKVIDGVIVGPGTAPDGLAERIIIIIRRPLAADDEPHHHDSGLLRQALDLALQSLG